MNWYYNNDSDLKDWIDQGNTCIFAFEGLGDPLLKLLDQKDNYEPANLQTSIEHQKWRYMAMMVVTKGKEIVYVTRRASTLPDYNTGTNAKDEYGEVIGPTTLKEGIYSYYMGNHMSKYVALKPAEYKRIAWYRNDGDFICSASKGTNLHASTAAISNRYKNSTGCQLIHYLDYVAFGKAVGFLDDTNELKDMLEWKSGSFGDYVANHVQTSNGKYAKSISVKYVLDRTYDETNGFYSNSNRFDEYLTELSNLENLDILTDEEIQRSEELQRYLSYYSSIEDSYKTGIFYPISKQCDTDACELH